mgnify:CR=1 FL=1
MNNRASSRIEQWSMTPLVHQQRIEMVEKVQILLMNHVIAGDNSKRFILARNIRDEWKDKWNTVLRFICTDLKKQHETIPSKNMIVLSLTLSGFDLESYIQARFSVSKFLNGICCYIYYLHKGIEIYKLPKHSYDRLVKTHELNDIMMEPLQSIEDFQIQLL